LNGSKRSIDGETRCCSGSFFDPVAARFAAGKKLALCAQTVFPAGAPLSAQGAPKKSPIHRAVFHRQWEGGKLEKSSIRISEIPLSWWEDYRKVSFPRKQESSMGISLRWHGARENLKSVVKGSIFNRDAY